jgi:rhodanese-related sulfurtransferase
MMKRTFYFIFFVGLAGILSCSNQSGNLNQNQEDVQTTKIAENVSVNEFKKLITDEVIILDVRRSMEFEAGHLKNAVNIDYFSSDFVQKVTELDKSKTLLIYCAAGGRSSGAMSKLSNSGYQVMYNMLGGFGAWKKAGFEYE